VALLICSMPSAGASASGSRRGSGILGKRGRDAAAAAAAAADASHADAAATATAAIIGGGSHEGATTPSSGPTLTKADIRAITDTTEPMITTKVSSAVNDTVVPVLSEHVMTTIKDTLQETTVGHLVAEVSDGVAAKLSEDMAPKIAAMVKQDMESTARPILDAIAGVTKELEELARSWLLQLAGAKSSTYAPAGTSTRLSVLRIAGYGTAVPP